MTFLKSPDSLTQPVFFDANQEDRRHVTESWQAFLELSLLLNFRKFNFDLTRFFPDI
jgi:hypothetical protein